MKGTLYIVATPIGNLEDMTDRARRILCEADVVAAEDTRTTQNLFRVLGIKNKTVSNHKFNEKRQAAFLLNELESGRSVALVSDAGTPCISDPGAVIVDAAAKRGIGVVGVCGASSVITALSICGFCSGPFAFYGFLPKEQVEIRKTIAAARNSEVSASVFFESPKRIKRTIRVFAEEAPDAELCLCNDLTKLYERVYRGKPLSVLEELDDNPSAEKGEYTLVAFFGRSKPHEEERGAPSHEAMIVERVVKNGGSVKEAVNALAEIHKGEIAKKEFYAASLRLRSLFSADAEDPESTDD